MNRKIAVALVALSMVAGAGVGFLIHQLNDGPAEAHTATPSDTASSPTPTPTKTTPTTPKTSVDAPPVSSESLIVSPGRIGPITIGMTSQQALATGLIVRDTERENVCDGTFYRWKSDQAHAALDLYTDNAGKIVSMGVSRGTYPTDQDIRIGDRLSAVREAYGDRLSDVQSAGYDQDGVFVHDGDRWLGFLLDSARDGVNDSTRVIFMEVTRGDKPGLMRDGC